MPSLIWASNSPDLISFSTRTGVKLDLPPALQCVCPVLISQIGTSSLETLHREWKFKAALCWMAYNPLTRLGLRSNDLRVGRFHAPPPANVPL